MKLTYLACALIVAAAYSHPIEEPAGLGELAPQLADLTKREPLALEKRANVEFAVWPTNNCQGPFTVITTSGNGAKGNFSPAQRSVRITQLTNGYHLTMYTGSAQSGVRTRFTSAEVGADKCWVGSWLSYGLYNQ